MPRSPMLASDKTCAAGVTGAESRLAMGEAWSTSHLPCSGFRHGIPTDPVAGTGSSDRRGEIGTRLNPKRGGTRPVASSLSILDTDAFTNIPLIHADDAAFLSAVAAS